MDSRHAGQWIPTWGGRAAAVAAAAIGLVLFAPRSLRAVNDAAPASVPPLAQVERPAQRAETARLAASAVDEGFSRGTQRRAAAPQAAAAPLAAPLPSWLGADQLRPAAGTALVLLAMGVVPVLVLIASGFVRITIVLSLLRQALGTPGIPPNQVLTAVAFLLTLLTMAPVWGDVYDQAVVPILRSDQPPDWPAVWQGVSRPVHAFMSRQIQAAGNSQDIWLFLRYLPGETQPQTYEQVPMRAMLPAFVLSELKTAFLIGFQLYLPFLVIDLVVAATTMAMGMLMLSPQAIAIPLKLLLFVMVDGWHLVAQLLLSSFVPMR